ncbi:low temperature requirement protein A [Deinococcus humi]|uniref:Low temperature requirement protein LtrA n=1 Tax=Deinococcus humi TaxID=662880 RepID=A0A7W8NGF5_9DEIO|nr:low temperature requirement protein A [Deinococcus humi]MBB5363718.1 low temperature requirement protein LtrA [Deinococcus humi]GGO29634.1 membrane protein [Deinococcus humi]
MMPVVSPHLMRHHAEEGGHRVTFLELFFDLVFVFAITQLSHFLLEHFTVLGAIQTAVLLLAVWWAWVYTSWVTNFLDPAHFPVRLMLIALMVTGLLMSAALPGAFGERGVVFAAALVTFQVGRSLFAWWAMSADGTQRRNFTRITVWLAFGGVLWLIGAFSSADTRLAWWLGALAIDYVGPAAGYALPRLGPTRTREWAVSGEHMAERAGLFVIIALGEGILVTGKTFADGVWSGVSALALGLTFSLSAAMWWTYFVVNAEVVAKTIRDSDDPGRLARFAYTYLHVPIVAGIVLSAVGDELILAHPLDPAGMHEAVAVVGGAGVFLIGNALFKRTANGQLPVSHLLGLGVLALLGFAAAAGLTTSLGLGALVLMTFLGVAAAEGRPARMAGIWSRTSRRATPQDEA